MPVLKSQTFEHWEAVTQSSEMAAVSTPNEALVAAAVAGDAPGIIAHVGAGANVNAQDEVGAEPAGLWTAAQSSCFMPFC